MSSKQLTVKKKECTPSWMLDKTADEEVNETLDGAYEEVPDSAVSSKSNIIGSHYSYKVKIKECGKLLKVRLCLRGTVFRRMKKFKTTRRPLSLISFACLL